MTLFGFKDLQGGKKRCRMSLCLDHLSSWYLLRSWDPFKHSCQTAKCEILPPANKLKIKIKIQHWNTPLYIIRSVNEMGLSNTLSFITPSWCFYSFVSFYYAQLFKKQICIKICISVFAVKIRWLWCFGVSSHCVSVVRLTLAQANNSVVTTTLPPLPKSDGFASGFTLDVFLWHLLLMTIPFFFSGPHSVLCWLGSPPGPRVILSHCQFFLCLSSKGWVSAASVSFGIFCHLMYSL